MVRKNTVYSLSTVVWVMAVFGATLAVLLGETAPYVTMSMLPVEGPVPMFGAAAALAIAGALVVGRLKKRAWRRAGREANLTSEGGLFGTPDLVGDRGGRPVRVRTITRKTGGGGGEAGGSSKTTYTIVEADLRGPAREGLIVGLDDGDLGDFGSGAINAETDSTGEFSILESAPGLGGAVLTGRARNVLAGPTRTDSVLAGNASGVFMDEIPEADGMVGSLFTKGAEKMVDEGIAGDESTVRAETKGLLMDGKEIARQVEAVVAVADEFEATTGQ